MRTQLNRAAPRGVPGDHPPGSAAADRGSLTIFVVFHSEEPFALLRESSLGPTEEWQNVGGVLPISTQARGHAVAARRLSTC